MRCLTATSPPPRTRGAPRKEGEDHEEYRLRVVERGDGDLFRAWQIMEAALEERSRTTFSLLARLLPAEQRRSLEADRSRTAVVHDEEGQRWRLGHCQSCHMRMARACGERSGDSDASVPHPETSVDTRRCDICDTIALENEVWAPHMPCKELSKKRKKKKKKKRRACEVTTAPTPEELLRIHQSRSASAADAGAAAAAAAAAAPPAKKICGSGMVLLGMDLQPEQTLRPTLQRCHSS